MNYYLTPEPIVEVLGLTEIRKSTATGMYLLSEYDLAPYGIDKAVGEGAIELSDNLPPLPGSDVQSPPLDETQGEENEQQESQEGTTGTNVSDETSEESETESEVGFTDESVGKPAEDIESEKETGTENEEGE